MTEEQKENTSSFLENAAAAASVVNGAIKTGKAVAKIAKGAAAGGPYGAIASALWENRKVIANIVIAAIAFLMIPIVVVMMLPSLIFGGFGDTFSPADPNNPIINSGTALLDATTKIANAVQAVLAEALSATEAEIQSNFENSNADRMEIVNPYTENMMIDANKLVSMYCAFKSDAYTNVSVDDLVQILRDNSGLLYSYFMVEQTNTVMTVDLETGELVPLTEFDPETGEIRNVVEVIRTYRITFTGEDYFADRIFALNEAQKELAKYYASNLNLFILDDNFAGTVNPSFAKDTTIDISGYTDPATKNNLDLVQWALEAEKKHWGYVLGTFAWVLDASEYEYKLKQYPDGVGQYSDFIVANWIGGRTADCVGLIKGYCWLNAETREVGYATNNMPDINEEQMFEYASEKGSIETIPEIPGLAVWFKGHIGIYIGEGFVIEAKGTRYGVVKTKLSDGRWTHWLKIPYISYLE